jgi:hypothetical protein
MRATGFMGLARAGWALLIALGLLTQLAGCLGYNHKKHIAVAFLTDPKGKLDEKALTAALLAKFPVGSPEAPVESFATSLGGKCHPNQRGGVSCKIPVSGTLCLAYSLWIDIQASDGALVDLHVGELDEFC